MMVYSIFLYMPLLFDLRGESHENVKWRHTLYINIRAKFYSVLNDGSEDKDEKS